MLPFGGLRGNVHGSSMARWKARGRLAMSGPTVSLTNIGRVMYVTGLLLLTLMRALMQASAYRWAKLYSDLN